MFRPFGAKEASPGRSPGDRGGRIGPILPFLQPRRGETQPPMHHPHAMGCMGNRCVSPLRGLGFHYGHPDPGLRPGLGCFAPSGRPLPTVSRHSGLPKGHRLLWEYGAAKMPEGCLLCRAGLSAARHKRKQPPRPLRLCGAFCKSVPPTHDELLGQASRNRRAARPLPNGAPGCETGRG